MRFPGNTNNGVGDTNSSTVQLQDRHRIRPLGTGIEYHRRKKTFFTFFILVTFLRFLRFLFSKRFLFLENVGKVQSCKQINKKHFQNNSNEILWIHK